MIERNYMKSDALIELDFLKNLKMAYHTHENYELFFVINGTADVTIENKKYHLRMSDMVLINVGTKHCYEGTEDLLIGRFCMSYTKIRDLLGREYVKFFCNSVMEEKEVYEDLRQIIVEIFKQTKKQDDGNRLFMNSLYYQLLHILCDKCLLPQERYKFHSEKEDDSSRLQVIFAYIRANFRQNISLNDLAEHLHLSSAYVSRYITQKCNISFMKLLNQVRLTHAMEDLIYTDDSVLKIAMDNGFSSVAAYNKVFKDAYGVSPAEFRKKRQQELDKNKEKESAKRTIVDEKIDEYITKYSKELKKKKEDVKLILRANLEKSCDEQWNRYCGKMINIGTISMLRDGSIQKQILEYKNKIGFEYVRFWGIYLPENYLDFHAKKGEQNFERLSGAIDFLVKNSLKPYIELGKKPVRILKNISTAIKEEKANQEFQTEEEMKNFYEELIRYLIRRYGAEEINTWYFEYWEDNNICFESELSNGYRYACMTMKEHKKYLKNFHAIAGTIKKYLPKARIGGAGFPIRLYGESELEEILLEWKNYEEPDFISLSCFPYILEYEEGKYHEKRTTDLHFMRRQLEKARYIMSKVGFADKELHVTEFSASLSNRNMLNDHCANGAFLMNTAISCLNKADMIGYWFFSDTYANGVDAKGILFGGCGLVSKIGIQKPSCVALDFMNRLYRNLIKIHENCLITRNEKDSLKIVCHNLKAINYKYYLMEEDLVEIRQISSLFEDLRKLVMHIKIENVSNGTYILKKNCLNQKYGSIQDRWSDLDMQNELTMHEIEYLKLTSIPNIKIQQIEVRDNILEFDTLLLPNEIQFLYLSLNE